MSKSEFESALAELKLKWKKMQDEGADYEVTAPDKTLKTCFNEWAERQPDKPYVIFRDRVYSYGECNLSARKLANGLTGLGLGKGDRVALYLYNSINFVLVSQACFKLGLIVVNSNPFDTPREIELKLLDCGAKTVLADEISLEAVSLALQNTAEVECLIRCCEEAPLSAKGKSDYKNISLADLMEFSADTEPEADLHPDEIQVLQYTGGTTGVLKGCCITHRNYLINAYGALEFYRSVIKEGEWSVILGIPLSHAYGFTQTIIGLLATGGSMILTDCVKPSIEEILQMIERYRPTIWPAVPVMLRAATQKRELLEKYDLSSLRAVSSGASPLPVNVITEFEELTGAKITEGYGLSEAVRTVTGMPFGVHRPGMVGIPYPNLEVLIVDAKTGTKVMEPNEYGEIIVRSPQLTKGYWNKKEETAQTFRSEWLYTGDIGYFDEDGILAIVDRKKDLILVNGFNVYPKEIDEVLHDHPDIVEAATIGVPDPKRGEAPKSFVVKRDDSAITAEAINVYLRERLAAYKIPRIISFVDSIPKTKTNKIDKRKLKGEIK